MAVPALAAPIVGALANILLGGLFRPKPPPPPTPPLALPGGYAPSTQLTGPEPTPPPAPNPMGPILSSLINAGIGAAFAPSAPAVAPVESTIPATAAMGLTSPPPTVMAPGALQMDPRLAASVAAASGAMPADYGLTLPPLGRGSPPELGVWQSQLPRPASVWPEFNPGARYLRSLPPVPRAAAYRPGGIPMPTAPSLGYAPTIHEDLLGFDPGWEMDRRYPTGMGVR